MEALVATGPWRLRLADSEVAAVQASPAGVALRFAAVPVQREGGARHADSGFARGVTLWLPGGRATELDGPAFGRVAEGRLHANGQELPLRLPGRVGGPLRLSLAFANRATLDVQAQAAECRFDGEADIGESFAC
jgi:hypothetical protein